MSIPFSNAVWAQSKMSGGELLMLLALADMADEHGTAWPAVATLAKRCRVSSRQANRSLAKLQSAGELEARRNEGRYGTNIYRILLQPGMTPASSLPIAAALTPPSSPPDTNVTPGACISPDAHVSPDLQVTLTPMSVTPDTAVTRPLTPVSPKSSVNHQEPESKKVRERATAAAKPDVVDQQVWNDWLALRKAKRAPVTDTVLKEAHSEAAKAGLTLESFLRVWCARGSQGLQADWLKPRDEAPRRDDYAPITTHCADTRADEFKAAMEQRSKDATKPPAEVWKFLRRKA